MNRIIVAVVLLTVLISMKFLFKDHSRDIDLPPTQTMAIGNSEEDACMPMDKFMMEHPDATPEEMYKIGECNKKRAAKQGLDKRNKGFLGNRNIRPKGALAHYEGGSGSFVFTLYKDHIFAKDIDEPHEIQLSSITTVKKYGNAIIIEYDTKSGKHKHYSVTLMGSDDDLKAEGNTDLDRLIDEINKLRGVAE